MGDTLFFTLNLSFEIYDKGCEKVVTASYYKPNISPLPFCGLGTAYCRVCIAKGPKKDYTLHEYPRIDVS